jgi:hypothetical protein
MLLLITTLKSKTLIVFIIIFRILSANKAAFVSTELANKAYAYLLTILTDATDPVTKACAYLLIALIDAIALSQKPTYLCTAQQQNHIISL